MKRWVWVIALGLAACSGEEEEEEVVIPRDAGPIEVRDGGFRDAGPRDAGEITDAGPRDAGGRDGGGGRDAGFFDAGPTRRGKCETDADCGGATCLRIPDVEGGYRTCQFGAQPEATMCPGVGPDECCSSAECTASPNGRCYLGPFFYCGGPAPVPANECRYDECATSADCTAMPNGICLPARAWNEPAARCLYGGCRVNSDCTDGNLAECTPFFDPCNSRMIGFFCTYESSECRNASDCTHIRNGYCEPGMNGMTTCREFIPPP